MEASRRELIGWVAAAGLVLTGVVVLIVALNRPRSFGWFAYAPLSETSYMPGASGSTLALTALGIVLLILGLVGTGFLAGLQVGRRSRTASRGPDRGQAGTQ